MALRNYVFKFIILFSVISKTRERSHDELYVRSHMCVLPQHSGTIYDCISRPKEGGVEVHSCEGPVPATATVLPRCQGLFYYSSVPLVPMTCVAGKWNSTSKCKPDCGKSKYTPDPLSPRVVAERGDAPWNVIIYEKKGSRYKFTCEGTITKEDRVETVPHCFWNDTTNTLNDLGKYVVVAGKLNRKWGADEDRKFEQISRISSGYITEYYRGRQTNLQDDVMVLYLSEPFVFSENLHSICMDYDYIFDTEQHREGAMGSVAVWDYAVNHNKMNCWRLSIIQMPYVDIHKCYNETKPIYYELLNSDKICVGYPDGSITLCPGASGSGLVTKYRDHHFLHGIVSGTTRPDAKHCGEYSYVSCTHVFTHRTFLRHHTLADNPYVGKCTTPPTPRNGHLQLLWHSDSVGLWKASCDRGYLLAGTALLSCVNGRWNQSVPICTTDYQSKAEQEGNKTDLWYKTLLDFEVCTKWNTSNFLMLILDYFVCGHVNVYMPVRVIVLLVISVVVMGVIALFIYVPCLKRYGFFDRKSKEKRMSRNQHSFDTLQTDSRSQSIASIKTLLPNKNLQQPKKCNTLTWRYPPDERVAPSSVRFQWRYPPCPARQEKADHGVLPLSI